jgi:hypothetical protein
VPRPLKCGAAPRSLTLPRLDFQGAGAHLVTRNTMDPAVWRGVPRTDAIEARKDEFQPETPPDAELYEPAPHALSQAETIMCSGENENEAVLCSGELVDRAEVPETTPSTRQRPWLNRQQSWFIHTFRKFPPAPLDPSRLIPFKDGEGEPEHPPLNRVLSNTRCSVDYTNATEGGGTCSSATPAAGGSVSLSTTDCGYSKDSRPATAGSVDVSDEVCVELALCMLMTKFVQDTQGAHGMQYVQASDLEAWLDEHFDARILLKAKHTLTKRCERFTNHAEELLEV